jgi:hypothetical protein
VGRPQVTRTNRCVRVTCEECDVTLPDALRIAIANPIGPSWQLDLTSAALAADPEAWTDDPVDDPEPGLAPVLALGSLIGPVLRYRAWDDDGIDDVAIHRPDDEAWRRYADALDRLRVWTWESQPLGGLSAWEITLLWNGRSLEISGSAPRPGPEWAGFLRATHRLAGGRGFDPR